jgi:hypothetical protein
MTLAFQGAVFLGAFLLFLVQPLIAKQILPWFGGGSSVWSACLLFFQLALVVGYAYAHHIRRLSPRNQVRLHLLLLLAAAATLPIAASPDLKPPDGERLVPRVLTLLALSVGAPYILLASTAPLLQDWYARLKPGQSPYWLYVLSNAGSLAALLAYPILIEPRLASSSQSFWWSVGFGIFALISGVLAWRAQGGAAEITPMTPIEPAPPVSLAEQFLWLLWPACGTGLLLATTSAITQDVAAVPLLWIAPLAAYLLTYMAAFAGIYSRPLWALVFAASLSAYYFMASGQPSDMKIYAGVLFSALISGCMLCHGELARLRPAVARLTEYYLALAVGGSFGGVFVAVAAPILFDSYLELPLLYITVLALLVHTVCRPLARRRLPNMAWIASAVVVALFLAGAVAVAQSSARRNAVATARGFYGVLTVSDDQQSERAMRRLYHGRILHGTQFITPSLRNRPTSYYAEDSGVDYAIRRHPRRRASEPLKIGAVGLGAGTLAAHALPGDTMRFFEIDPLVIEFSRRYFTYLKDSGATIDIVTGDARLSLEREMLSEANHHTYDVIAVDAFSGDSVPVHLLTREAFALYDLALKPDGILAVHISNRYLDLKPVVYGAALERKWKLLMVAAGDNPTTRAIASSWLLATRNEEFVGKIAETAIPNPETMRQIIWTDDFSSLLSVLR